jgi:hypothetical protein
MIRMLSIGAGLMDEVKARHLSEDFALELIKALADTPEKQSIS